MRRPDSLYRDFKILAKETDERRRGRMFELLIQRLFTACHYRVKRGPRMARPRQTDLLASKDRDDYLIEVKWQENPADVADLDNLQARLHRTPLHLIGMLLSMSGFTKQAIAELENHRQRIVLLFDFEEIDRLLSGNLEIDSLIREKRDAFVGEGRVSFLRSPSHWRTRPIPDRTVLPSPDLQIVVPQSDIVPWISGAGGFGPLVFARDLPDVDSIAALGSGVGFDLPLHAVRRPEDLAYVLDALRDVGWISEFGCYSILQSEVCWHGTGAGSFLNAIDAWTSRYANVKTRLHHTEEATYMDLWEHGFFTFVANLSHDNGHVHHAKISAQLYGIPLSTESFRLLASTFGREGQVYFRPLKQPAISTHHWSFRDHRLTPVAFLCSSDRWVEGIVVRNPFYLPKRSQSLGSLHESLRPLREHELICCRLSSAHELGAKVDFYFLRHAEATRTDDVAVFCVTADWHMTDRKRRSSDHPRAVSMKDLEDEFGTGRG